MFWRPFWVCFSVSFLGKNLAVQYFFTGMFTLLEKVSAVCSPLMAAILGKLWGTFFCFLKTIQFYLMKFCSCIKTKKNMGCWPLKVILRPILVFFSIFWKLFKSFKCSFLQTFLYLLQQQQNEKNTFCFLLGNIFGSFWVYFGCFSMSWVTHNFFHILHWTSWYYSCGL